VRSSSKKRLHGKNRNGNRLAVGQANPMKKNFITAHKTENHHDFSGL
jgi:hypothetical protein